MSEEKMVLVREVGGETEYGLMFLTELVHIS